MKTWDVVIIGGGIIGVSLALSLNKHGAEVLIVDKGEPGREASHAAAGMLAHCEQSEALRPLAVASARLYPEFVHEIEDESGLRTDYRRDGTIVVLSGEEEEPFCDGGRRLDAADLAELEPKLSPPTTGAAWLPEATVDPRALAGAAVKAARHRGIQFSSGTAVTGIDVSNLGIAGVITAKTRFPAAAVVNCAGAWAGEIAGPLQLPVRPVKGQMLDVIPESKFIAHGAGVTPAQENAPLLRHVVRAPDIYLVPRSDGRITIGSTVEDAGFDKRVQPDTIQRLHQAAANLLPEIGEAKIHEAWAGLRPGSPDNLPLLGQAGADGYFVASGHFRDGILLAPITARLMTQVIRGEQPEFDLEPFNPMRFKGI